MAFASAHEPALTHGNDGGKTDAPTERMQQLLEKIRTYRREDYVKNETLVGAHPLFLDATYTHTFEDKSHDQHRQLEKLDVPGYDRIVGILSEYAKESPAWCEWTSETLQEDLSLPITSPPPCRLVQVFMIGVHLSPFVLTCYDDTSKEEEVRQYANQTASALKWRLLEFCHLDFLLLPCIATKNFDLAALREEIMNILEDLSECFGGATHLDEDMFHTMKEATTALAGLTSLPCLLDADKTAEMRQEVMEKEWRGLLSLLIETLSKQQQQIKDRVSNKSVSLRASKDGEFKASVAVLEAVKRLSLRNTFCLKSSVFNEELPRCLHQLKTEMKKRYDVCLRLSTCTDGESPQEVLVLNTPDDSKLQRAVSDRCELQYATGSTPQSPTDQGVKYPLYTTPAFPNLYPELRQQFAVYSVAAAMSSMAVGESEDSLFSLREMVDQQAREQAIFAARLADFPHSFQLRSPNSLTPTRLKKHTNALKSALSVGYKTGLETARARNMLAYFLHRMDRSDDALNELDQVLAMEDQHDNLVTLANKANILWKQYRLSEADEYVERLQQIRKSPDFKYLVTKAKAEIAFTYTRFDPSFFPDAERIFLEVIPDAREPELWLWKFGLTLTRRREIRAKPHENLMVPTPTADVTKKLHDLLDLFLEIAEKCSSKNLRAKVYAEIAIVLNFVRKSEHKKTFYKKAGMNVHQACERALELDGDDNSVLCKCGKMFRYVRRNEESRALLEKAVSIRPSTVGYHHLGLTLQRLAEPQERGYTPRQHSRGGGTSRYQNTVSKFASMSVGRSAQSEAYEPHRLFTEQMSPNSGNRGNNRRGNRGRYNRGNPENYRQVTEVPGRNTTQRNNPQHNPETRFPRGNSVQHYNDNGTPTGRNNTGDAQGMTFTRGGYAANSRDQHHKASPSGMSAASRGTTLSVSLPESKEAKIMQELLKSPTKEKNCLSWDNMLVREAERNFKLAVEFSAGENTRALFDLALVRTKTGFKEKALADLRQILQIEKNICVFEHIRVYEQMGLITKEMAESEANEEKKKQLLNDSKSMLLRSLTIASRFFSRSQGGKEYIQEVLVSFTALLKDVEDSKCSALQKMEEKAKLYELIRNHGQSLDLLKEIEKMDPEKTEDPEYLKLCITQYMALEKFDEALAFKSLLECTSQGMQTIQLFADPSLEAKLYILAARHALLHDKPSAKGHFQTLFRDTVLLNVDHESVTSEDTDASEDPRTEAAKWNIMILHEDRTEEKAAALTHILQDTCGLSVATMDKDAPPNKVVLEGGLWIMRMSSMVLVLAGTKPVSREMRFLMHSAVKRRTTVTLLVDGEHVPKMLHTHRSMVCPGHLFTQPAGAEAAEIERERRTLQVNAICNVIRFIVNLDMNADWI